MTLRYELNLDSLNAYLHTKINFTGRGLQQLEHKKVTRRQMQPNTLPRLHSNLLTQFVSCIGVLN